MELFMTDIMLSALSALSALVCFCGRLNYWT